MLRKVLVAATAAVVTVGLVPTLAATSAHAAAFCTSPGSAAHDQSATCSADANVAFTVASTGSRVLTNTTAALGLTSSNSSGAVNIQGTWAAQVVETAINGCCGTNPWKVTAQLVDANNAAATNQISSGNTGSGGFAILGQYFTVQNSATPTILLGATGVTATSGNGTDQNLSAERTLFNVNNEASANLYGTPATTYSDTGSLTLTVQNGTPTGTYSGVFRETLYN
jgi:hypothetical protein